jgi:hypothetical protein
MIFNKVQEVNAYGWGHIYPFIHHMSACFICEIAEKILIKSGTGGLL